MGRPIDSKEEIEGENIETWAMKQSILEFISRALAESSYCSLISQEFRLWIAAQSNL